MFSELHLLEQKMEKVWQVFKKLNIELPYDPANPGTPKDMKID